MLRSVDWYLVTDVSRQPIGPIFKGQAVQEDSSCTVWPLKIGPIGCLETSVNTNLRCITSQRSEYLIYTAAEAWNYAIYMS